MSKIKNIAKAMGESSLYMLLTLIAFIIFFFISVTRIFETVDKPVIKQAEFDFMLVYEIEGQQYTYADTLVCKYAGVEGPIGLGDSKSIKWVSWYKSTEKERPIVLRTIRYNDEEYSLNLDIGWPAYFMDHSNSRRDYREPDIYFLLGGYGSIGSDTEAALIEKTGFKIISWECDPPIKNEYK